MLAKRNDLIVEERDLIALLRAEVFGLAQFALGPEIKVLQLGEADFAGLDFGLRERGAVFLAGKRGFQLSASVARGGEFIAHRGNLVVMRLDRRSHLADLPFQIGPHGLQRLDIAAQLLGLREQQPKFLFAHLGTQERRRAVAFGLGRLGERRLRFRGHVTQAQLQRIPFAKRLGQRIAQPVPLRSGVLHLGRELGHVDAEIGVGAALQGEQIGQLADLTGQLVQRLILPGHRALQKILREHVDHEQENHDQQQRRQHIDEARPDIG